MILSDESGATCDRSLLGTRTIEWANNKSLLLVLPQQRIHYI